MWRRRSANRWPSEECCSETLITGWSIDSRSIRPGDLFFALRGARFDGHNFLSAVTSRGAAAVIVDRDSVDQKGDTPCPAIRVPDVYGR